MQLNTQHKHDITGRDAVCAGETEYAPISTWDDVNLLLEVQSCWLSYVKSFLMKIEQKFSGTFKRLSAIFVNINKNI